MRWGTQKFALQFQWEVDRLVFRHRQRGAPVEVTEEERDRLVERYAARSKLGMRFLLLSVIGSSMLMGFLSSLIPYEGYMVGALYAGIVLSLFMIERWAFDGTTAHLRQRPAIGEKLGLAGQFIRPVAGIPAGRLWFSVAYLAVVTWLFMSSFPDDASKRWSIALFAITGGFLLAALLIKGALHERARLRRESMEAIHRARDLHVD